MTAETPQFDSRSAANDDANLPEILYSQLRAAAQQQMNSERQGHTLSATALVHEAYLRLAGTREQPWQGRGHFYAAAVEAMRRVLLDHAKARHRLKRGGDSGGQSRPRARIDLDQAATMIADQSENVPDYVAIDDAICRLGGVGPRVAEIVRLRFYAGLSTAQIAEVLDVSERTVTNDWTFAKAWLTKDLESEEAR